MLGDEIQGARTRELAVRTPLPLPESWRRSKPSRVSECWLRSEGGVAPRPPDASEMPGDASAGGRTSLRSPPRPQRASRWARLRRSTAENAAADLVMFSCCLLVVAFLQLRAAHRGLCVSLAWKEHSGPPVTRRLPVSTDRRFTGPNFVRPLVAEHRSRRAPWTRSGHVPHLAPNGRNEIGAFRSYSSSIGASNGPAAVRLRRAHPSAGRRRASGHVLPGELNIS